MSHLHGVMCVCLLEGIFVNFGIKMGGFLSQRADFYINYVYFKQIFIKSMQLAFWQFFLQN